MMHLLQKYYDCRAIVFTTTPSILDACKSLGIATSSNMTLNPYGLPYIGSLFHSAASLYSGRFYGYINADILLSSSIMEVLAFIESSFSSRSPNTLIEVCHNSYNVMTPKLTADMTMEEYDASYAKLLKRNIDPMVIARSRIDTYMMYYALKNKGLLIDIGDASSSLHQGQGTYTNRAKGVAGDDYNWNKDRSKKYFVDLSSATSVVKRKRNGLFELEKPRRVVLRKKKSK